MKFFRILLLLFLLSFGSTIFFAQMVRTDRKDLAMEIHILSGMTVRDIATELKEQGIVPSATAFRWYLQSQGLDTGIRIGTFEIPSGASFAEIAKILRETQGGQLVVTVPEGFTVTQIDGLLAKKGVIQLGELLACSKGKCDFSSFDFLPSTVLSGGRGGALEGYLFPDTYYVDPNDFVAKFFLERMLGTFRSRIIDGLSEDIASSNRSLEEIMTMASLIEREAANDAERPMIAGILWKRFDAHQGLAVDATVRYAIEKETEPLTKSDLESNSPYNTRKYAGLPPGPIANPGLASIKAALHPVESPYWYYLHGNDGQIRYAETNDEHNANKAKYL